MFQMRCNKNGCCSVTFCPLVPAWASTIHKFQGFEAGFDDADQFKYLIVDPGTLKWEHQCPGALYTAISRAKTMGTFFSDTDNPSDSAIYFHGNGICEDRIRYGALRKGAKKGDPRRYCKLINKREQWVSYLARRREETTRNEYTDKDIRLLKNKRFSQAETREGIVDIITQPNTTWLLQKRSNYRMQTTYFGTS